MSAQQRAVNTSVSAYLINHLSIYSLITLSTLIRSPGPLLVLSYTFSYLLPILYYISTSNHYQFTLYLINHL